MAFQKGVAQTIQIICYDSETPTDPDTPVAYICADDDEEFTETTNAPVVVGSGLVTLGLTAAEMNCDSFTIKIESEDLEDQMVSFYTEAAYTATRAGYLDAAISTRSIFDPTTDIVKAKDHEGNPFITDEDVASGVWGAEKREVTGGTVDDISGRDLTNLDVAVGSRAVAGDAMTLTGGERSNIATAVWGATTRTLSSFGSLASDAAAAVWSAVARTITGGAVSSVGGKTLDNLDVAISTRAPSGEYDNEMAHLDADVSAVPGNVWEHDTRELTEEIDVGISESDKDDVADRVWGHTTRSLNVPIPTEISSHDRDLIAAAVGEFARLRLLIADRTLEVKAPMQIADGRGNLRIVRDDDVVLPFVWTGTDLSGYTIYMTVRPDTGSDADPTDATATFQVEADITDAGAGKFEFGIGRTQTGACRTDVEYWYDVQAISPEGDITTLIIATLSVIGDVTRRTG